MTATIEAHGLEKRYGTTRALDGLDLVARRGELTAVLGPNGAGKTTFVRALATLLRLDGGTLRVAGHDVRRDPHAVRCRIGLAGQFAAVEPAMSGRENLEMVARLFGQTRRTARSGAGAVLEQLGLTEIADRLVRTYSGGMRRRLDLGASLVGAPRLLLLDEPTTGLDPRSRIELWDAIRTLVQAGTDVLLTTQYLDEADRLASRIVIIDHGRAVAQGTPTELKRRVGGNVIEAHVRRGDQLARVAEVLGGMVEGQARIDAATRRVSVGVAGDGGGGDALTAALHALEHSGVEIDGIALRQPTLDEVFLALTGKATETDDATTHARAAA
jgi:ABC-2 type transport system ATP-binding protein